METPPPPPPPPNVPLECAVDTVRRPATTALAQISSFCASGDGDVCAAVNLPSSGNDTYIQIKGSQDSGWVATGIGKAMAGALIFVIYPNSNGRNVTVSPRLGRYGCDSRSDADMGGRLTLFWSGDTCSRSTRATSTSRSWRAPASAAAS